MRRDVVGLGVALAIGGLAYGSSRVPARPLAPSPPIVGVIAPAESSPWPRTEMSIPPTSVPVALRARPGSIASHVRQAAVRYGVAESLVAAVISVESEFNPRAVSRRGAIGLMQLMPSTAVLLGVRDAFDPQENVDAGARHLRDLLDRFANDVSLALAAYNAGAQAVIRHGGVPPYPETRAFVARVLGRIGQVTMPAVAVAQASGPAPAPRIRLARLTADRLRRAEEGPGVLKLRGALSDDTVVLAVFDGGAGSRADATPVPPPPAAPVIVSVKPVGVVSVEAP
jgi:soluble lytic murein transglycosylase-like protein